MDRKNALLIVNPVSGVKSKKEIVADITKSLTGKGFHLDTEYTQRQGHAQELAEQGVKEGYGTILVCGGDGTVNEAASGLCGTDSVMGIIPAGSGNGLARHLGIPVDALLSLDVVTDGNFVKCDYGEVVGETIWGTKATRRFFCTCGVGFDAQVAHQFAHEHQRGKITYIKKIIEEFGKYQPSTYRLTLDGKEIVTEAFIIACCNASQYGNNAFIAPNASVTDGLFDLVIVKSSSALKKIVAGFDIMMGMIPYNKDIETYRVKEAVIETDGPSWGHIDGDPIPFGGKATAHCLPGQLQVYAKPLHEAVTPFITPIDMVIKDFRITLEHLFHFHKH